MKDNPLHQLGDAALMAILLIAVLAGTSVWLVFSIYLGLEIFSKLLRAFNAWAQPIVEVLREFARR